MSSLEDELQTLLGASIAAATPRTARCLGWWHHIPGEGWRYPGALHAAAGAGNASLLPAALVLGIKSVSTRGRGKDFFFGWHFQEEQAISDARVSGKSHVLWLGPAKSDRVGGCQTSHGCLEARGPHCPFFFPLSPLTETQESQHSQPIKKIPTYHSAGDCANRAIKLSRRLQARQGARGC